MVTGLDVDDHVYQNASYQCHNVRMDSEISQSEGKSKMMIITTLDNVLGF